MKVRRLKHRYYCRTTLGARGDLFPRMWAEYQFFGDLFMSRKKWRHLK